jgi:hypothetical protein
MAISYHESVTGGGTPTTNISTPITATSSIGGGTDQTYVCFVALRDALDWRVTTMSGGGLSWIRFAHHQDTQETILSEWWYAQGSPSSFTPQLDAFSINSGPTDTSLAAVSFVVARFSGVETAGALDHIEVNDAGSTDSTPATISHTIDDVNDPTVLIGLATRGFTVTAADSDYTLIGTATAGSAGNVSTVYLHRRANAPAGADTTSHTLSGAADWIMHKVELIEEAGGGGGGSLHGRLLLGVGG